MPELQAKEVRIGSFKVVHEDEGSECRFNGSGFREFTASMRG